MIVDRQYYALTQDQTSNTRSWAKIMTLHQNYKGIVDWHENNITFKLFQANGIDYHTETTFYLSTSKRDNETSNILFYDLDMKKSGIECRYILNDTDIDVYVKGNRVGCPIKLQVVQCPKLGTITFYQRRGFETFTDEVLATMVAPSLTNYFTKISPINSGSKFYYDTESVYKIYQEYSASRYEVTLKSELTVMNQEFTGTHEYIFTIPTIYVPFWAIPDGSEYVEWTQDYSYKPSASGTGTIHGNKCRVQIYKNGQVFADGMMAMNSNIYRIVLSLDIRYKINIS